ncbi:MAG: DUF1963 domain-containing protein [Methylocella sp.]
MPKKEVRDEPKSPAELRAAFIDLTHKIEAVEHIGRINRLYGRRRKIVDQLIAAGGNSERELLPLLDDSSPAIRYDAAFDVKPFDRARFEAVLKALVEGGGEIGRKARSSLEHVKRQDEEPPPRLLSDDPEIQLVPHLYAWQASNPPPPGISRAQLEDLVRARFPEHLLPTIMSLARPAIGLWPSAATAPAPSGTRIGGRTFAPPGWDWPLYEEEPMFFLAQIHCPDLKGLPGAELLPETGLLSFFGDHDAINGCDGADPSQSAIYHWTGLDRLVPTDPPLELEARAEQGVVLRPFVDLPHPWSMAAETLHLASEEQSKYASLYLDALEHGIPAQVRGGYCVHNKLLGWPRLVQNDLSWDRRECGDPSLRLLLQLDGDIGPGGSVYFLMNSADLAARRFDHNEFAVQVT